MTKWLLRKNNANIEAMSNALEISHILSTVLVNRGINKKSSVLEFLNPQKEDMYDTSQLKDIDKAVKVINGAVSKNKKIVIYGDYDVDGVMSTSILYKAFKCYGADISCYIPKREEEGYGMNKKAINILKNSGVDLIITCDNGISAIDEIAYAKQLGLNIIVIDHHEPGFVQESGVRKDILPDADAIINPKQEDCKYPFKAMCAAGICYKFVKYFYQTIGKKLEYADEYLMLSSIATVCDIVDLVEENRNIVKFGLDIINSGNNTNIGLKALMKERKIDTKEIGTFDIGFIIGPCINACGRLETAMTAVRLFTCTDEKIAEELAKKLSQLNDERKIMTSKAVDLAMNALQKSNLDKVIVLHDPNIHESIAGIVAGRIKDKFYHPTIILCNGTEFAKASARSIEGYNLFEELYKCKDLFEKFGGHEMAAGFSIKHNKISILKDQLNSNCNLSEEDFVQIVRIDKEIPISKVTFELANELRLLEPFGRCNKEPIFATKNLTADLIETIGEDKKTLRFTFTQEDTGRKIKAVCFNKLEQFSEMLEKKYGEVMLRKFEYGRVMNIALDFVYCVQINEYNGNTYVNMIINDFRI